MRFVGTVWGEAARSLLFAGWFLSSALGARAEAISPALDRDRSSLDRLLINRFGRAFLELRPRYEWADARGSRPSNALTLRTQIGFGTRVWRGLSALVEGESVLTADQDLYFDGVSGGNDRTFVPDPQDVGVNRAFLLYAPVDVPLRFTFGRQRLVLDDARFVGNVGWRQNEQTYDALRVSWEQPLPRRTELTTEYVYLARALRIFGDRGSSATRDFRSESHLARLGISSKRYGRLQTFAYLLEFENAPDASSATIGGRYTHAVPFSHALELHISLSYAHQQEWANQPIDYETDYQSAFVGLEASSLGRVDIGVERLGSDGGDAVFATPLGTLHEFNGTADVFLDNGGPDGLIDATLSLRPRLPARLEARADFHWFSSDQERRRLGYEIDAEIGRPINRYVSVLAKAAWFEGRNGAGRPTTLRFWLMATLRL